MVTTNSCDKASKPKRRHPPFQDPVFPFSLTTGCSALLPLGVKLANNEHAKQKPPQQSGTSIAQVSLRPRDTFWDIQVSKTHSIFDSHCCPGRPASVAFLHAPLVCAERQLPPMAGRRVQMRSLFPLWRACARRVNSIASRLPGTNRLRFAFHGGQRWSRLCLPVSGPARHTALSWRVKSAGGNHDIDGGDVTI